MIARRSLWRAVIGVLAAAPLALAGALAQAQPKETVLRAVMHSDLKILDPIWTTALIVRAHGYMVYDTLFALDSKMQVKPQMVDKWEVSADKLTYTFTLRPGLQWHDGQPVTAEDCIASLKRWGSRDTMGQKLLALTRKLEAVDQNTFRLVLKEPYGLVLDMLAKSTPFVPFMMPKRVAETPATEQISDFTGSGPFVFKRDAWRPGEKAVYVRNTAYRPRTEPPSGMAGGKNVMVDRVEWLAMPDQQTALNALLAGEADLIEAPAPDLLPLLKQEKDIVLVRNPENLGLQYVMRFNWLQPPFDNVKIRRAAMVALNQEDFLKASIGDPENYQVCKAIFGCGTPLASDKGADGLLQSNFEASKKLLQEAGYDGTPVVLLHSPDVAVLANLAPVARDLLIRGGFKVDMQSMDWQTLTARRNKKDPPSQGGWNVFLTANTIADSYNPAVSPWVAGSCEKALFGWPCDETVEKLRDQFEREANPTRQKEIAEAVQARVYELGITVPLGQWITPVAVRRNVTTHPAALLVFWNTTKKGD